MATGSPMLQMLSSAMRSSSFGLAGASPARSDSMTEEDAVLTFGWGANGQLGTGDRTSRISPWRIATYKRVLAVATGSRFTMVLTSDGDVWTFGKNDHGQLGHGDRNEYLSPRRIDCPEFKAGTIVEIATRGAHALALDAEGAVYSWGRCDEGQLGHGDTEECLTPTAIKGFGGRQTRLRKVSCGRTHSLALDEKGSVWSWGSGDDGAHGHGTHDMISYPKRIASLAKNDHARVVIISAGSRHNCVVNSAGEVITWGWGAYAQLGHGDRHDKLAPQTVHFVRVFSQGAGGESSMSSSEEAQLVAARGGETWKFEKVACGYRHTMATRKRSDGLDELWAWGWNAFGQCGAGRSTVMEVPTHVEHLPQGKILAIGAGGGHSMACVAMGRATTTYSWGRGDDGQLGVGASDVSATPRKCEVPRRVNFARGVEARGAARFSCGWAHSVAVVKASVTVQAAESERFFSRGDFDGLVGQLLGAVLGFVIIQQLMEPYCGFTAHDVATRVMPGAALSTAFGAFALTLQARVTPGATAQPSGVSCVLLAAVLSQVCSPELAATGDPEKAYGAALFVASLVGLMELAMCPFVHLLKQHVPDAALHASVAGQALVALAMSFACDVFGAPADALPSLIFVFVGYGAATRLPWNVPGGAAGMALGAVLAPLLRRTFGYAAAGESKAYEMVPLSWNAPQSALSLLAHQWTHPEISLRYVAVAIPLAITNLANNLAMVESASSVGDEFSITESVAIDAVATIIGALFGCPFPTTIFIGHPAFKAMGARSGYMAVYGALCLAIGCSDATRSIMACVPLAAGAGFMLWIGLACTASAFGRDDQSSAFLHAAPVALGLIPCIAAWGVQLVVAVSAKDGTLLDMFDRLEDHGVNVRGLCALSQGSLMSSVTLAAMLSHILERRFAAATGWCAISSALAAMGVIHSYRIIEGGTAVVADVGPGAIFRNPVAAQFCLGYGGGACILLMFWLRDGNSETLPMLRHQVTVCWRAIVNLPEFIRTGGDPASSERTPLNVAQTSPAEIGLSAAEAFGPNHDDKNDGSFTRSGVNESQGEKKNANSSIKRRATEPSLQYDALVRAESTPPNAV